MTRQIAFTTIHGSRLYGLDHEGSDKDNMIVYNDDIPARHKKSGDEDYIHVGVFDLIEKAMSGSHQFVEGLYSQHKIWEDETYRPLIESVRIAPGPIREKYVRTIKKFCFMDGLKYQRHAVRLYCNLFDLTHSGRMDPTLSAGDRQFANWMATRYAGQELFENLFPSS